MITSPAISKPSRMPWAVADIFGCLALCLLLTLVGVTACFLIGTGGTMVVSKVAVPTSVAATISGPTISAGQQLPTGSRRTAASTNPAAPTSQSSSMGSNNPRLFFTDLESGPNTGGQNNLGAFVTIYGEGFGASRGNSTVTIGGKQVAKYVIWGENNAYARKMDMVVVQLGPEVMTGDVIITVNGKISNPLPFIVRSGNILFVSPNTPNAADSNPGAFERPFKTLYREPGQVNAGDIVYVKGGSIRTADPRYPGWDCVLCLFPDNDANGTADAPIAYIGYPGDAPILGAPQPMRRALYLDQAIEYYVFANVRFTHYGGTVELAGNGHRLVGNYSYDGVYSNSGSIGITGDSAHYKIFGNRIRNTGELGEKMNGSGFYLQGFGTNDDIDFGWNQIEDQRGSRAIQVYGHLDNDRIDHLRIHDNLLSGSELNNIVLGGSDGSTDVLGTVYVYNNIIIGAGDPGLRVNDPQGTVMIQNNVFYYNGSPGYGGSNAQVLIERAGPGKITLQNNILVAGANQTYLDVQAAPGFALQASHNLCYGAGVCPNGIAKSVNANPLFVDMPSMNACVKPGSPAIDTGTSTGIKADYLGISRPQSLTFDIGACEFSAP